LLTIFEKKHDWTKNWNNISQQVVLTMISGCPLSFENGGTMGYNCCFFLNFVPLHIESPYNFGVQGLFWG
jgi:hypothetical protein